MTKKKPPWSFTPSAIEMTGQRFGLLVVIGRSHSNNGIYWQCQCDCGQLSAVKGTSLRNGTTKSCGCGSIKTALVNVAKGLAKRKVPFPYPRKMKDMYKNMQARCYDPANKRWANYGGRGIKVCDEWLADIRAFYKWVSENGYEPGLTIDRIDVNGNYEPGNCRFVDMFVQQNNTTRNHRLTWNDKTQTIAQWARELGVNPRVLQHRIARDWSVERIFTQPFRGRR